MLEGRLLGKESGEKGLHCVTRLACCAVAGREEAVCEGAADTDCCGAVHGTEVAIQWLTVFSATWP